MKGILSLIVCIALISCEVGPKEITYGEQSCHFCKMTIVDQQHAAQLVTSKGKIYNFDAIECMAHFYLEKEQMEFALVMVNDYASPSKLMEAKNSTFLISDAIPSPMGANLSAVANREKAEALLQNKTGQLYTWDELLKHFESLIK